VTAAPRHHRPAAPNPYAAGHGLSSQASAQSRPIHLAPSVTTEPTSPLTPRDRPRRPPTPIPPKPPARPVDDEDDGPRPLSPPAPAASPPRPGSGGLTLYTGTDAGVQRPPAELRLPFRPVEDARLYVVAAHGGAGASTIAALVGGYDVGTAWPGTFTPVPTVLCARTSALALTAARNAIKDWAAGGVPTIDLLGLVLIADAPGRLPRELRRLVDRIKGAPPQLWPVPWHTPWRLGGDPDPDTAPRPARRLVRDLLYLAPDPRSASLLELTSGE
jgi:hypothetical protein